MWNDTNNGAVNSFFFGDSGPNADAGGGGLSAIFHRPLYQRSVAPGIVDATQGNNTVSFVQGGALQTVQGFSAGPGYDLASGVGTVDAARLVPELAAAADAFDGPWWHQIGLRLDQAALRYG